MYDTKSCNLNADEIIALIMLHGIEMDEDNMSETIERINYLNKRLKEFSKAANTPITADTDALNPVNQAIKETGVPAAQGWT